MAQEPRPRKTPQDLRSHRWLGPDDLRSFGHRSRIKQAGYGPADYEGKPVIGILSTRSDLDTCHTHFPQRVRDAKRGVLQAGGHQSRILSLDVDAQDRLAAHGDDDLPLAEVQVLELSYRIARFGRPRAGEAPEPPPPCERHDAPEPFAADGRQA